MAKRVNKKITAETSNASISVAEAGLVVETSWEVCNKVGGIYTVLSTKAAELCSVYGDRVVFIGPDVWTSENESPYFLERKTLLKSASSKLALPEGIKIRVGRWNIPGSPAVVLVDFKSLHGKLDSIYGEMWERFGVDSLHSYGDYDESCEFAVAASIVIKALAAHLKVEEDKVVAHFDEWTTGMGLLNTRITMPKAATVFTTHATSIGRSICGNGKDLYAYFNGYDGDQMASELNMQSKHSLEKAAAWNADCFTTVSEVTARECEQLLGIRPAVVTPNGFDFAFVPKSAAYNRLRKAGREKLLRIASIMGGKEYGEDTLIVATSGRNEYRNKGLDLYLDSMSALSSLHPQKDIVAFVLVPAWMKEPSGALLVDMKDNGTEAVEPDFLTHRLNNEDSDSVAVRISILEHEGKLENVKVIYVPCYLSGNDGIVDISYYDLLPAIDITVFGSYYEPWGYTPLESVAFGVPTITTDKAGFGQWVADNCGVGIDVSGVDVLPRDDSNYGKCVQLISETLIEFSRIDPKERKKASSAASATAKKADWSLFISKYREAYDLAMSKASERK